jgi:hypothetical protein
MFTFPDYLKPLKIIGHKHKFTLQLNCFIFIKYLRYAGITMNKQLSALNLMILGVAVVSSLFSSIVIADKNQFGIYIGYYQESSKNNPEDPMPGSFYINIPETSKDFSGAMAFTFVGCQSHNVGHVNGTKTDSKISGTWDGNVDGSIQKGKFSGAFDEKTQSYTGTYTNDGGKQFKDLRPCIQYYIAAEGTFVLAQAGGHAPSDFIATISNDRIIWPALSQAYYFLISVFDVKKAKQGDFDSVVHQEIIRSSGNNVANLPSRSLIKNNNYIVSVSGFSADGKQMGYSSSELFYK